MSRTRRLALHEVLCDMLGSRNVYFQPPENVKLKYPCVLYERDNFRVSHADNMGYLDRVSYQITFVTKDPDSDVPSKIRTLPGCRFNRYYVADNLHHDVYTIYY